jgi:hypothetical protein
MIGSPIHRRLLCAATTPDAAARIVNRSGHAVMQGEIAMQSTTPTTITITTMGITITTAVRTTLTTSGAEAGGAAGIGRGLAGLTKNEWWT